MTMQSTSNKAKSILTGTLQGTNEPCLTINQRNLYLYFLNHNKKYKTAPCFVPKCSTQNGVQIYLNALIKLEQYGLMRVDRNSDNYTGWIMLEPKN